MESVEQIIKLLGLQPHPEGGLFAESWRDLDSAGLRGHGTAIYFLLRAGEQSRWHRIDATEIWHFYAGSPLRIKIADGAAPSEQILGSDFAAGQRPQIVVPPSAWQSAQSLGAWTLVGCTVSPAFDFDHFEMADPGWEPG